MSEQLEIVVAREGSGCVLTLLGEADVSTEGDLTGALDSALRSGAEQVTVCMKGLQYADSHFMIVGTQYIERAQQAGVRLRFVEASSAVARIAEIVDRKHLFPRGACKVPARAQEGVCVLTMPEEVDVLTVPNLRDTVLYLADTGCTAIALDMGGTRCFGADGFRFVNLLLAFRKAGGCFALATVGESVLKMLDISGHRKHLLICSQVDEAIRELRAIMQITPVIKLATPKE